MKPLEWKQARRFYERVDRLGLHGLHFQHIALCERRAWLYLHNVNFAHWHSRVALGTVRHANAFKRDRSVVGLFGLAPDRVDWENCVVHENKGTGGAVVAADSQTAFYALMLSIATGRRWRAKTHVVSTRKVRDVELNDDCLERLDAYSLRLEALSCQRDVPTAKRIPLCHTCSAAIFCGYG
jgi:CRISPR-associated exonuclease Cas4